MLLVAAVSLALLASAPAAAAARPGRSDFHDPPGGGSIVRLMAVGDVMLAQSIGRRIKDNGLLAPWANVKPYFDQADLVVANLECVISDRGTPWPKTFTFRSPITAAQSLATAGIDAVTDANNHAVDYGFDSFADTLSYLDAAGVGHFGGGANLAAARAPLIITKNGLRIAFLGYVLPFSGKPAFNTKQWAATRHRQASPSAIRTWLRRMSRRPSRWRILSSSWSTAGSSTASIRVKPRRSSTWPRSTPALRW